MRSALPGVAEGDPLVVGLVVAFVAVMAVAYVVMRLRGRRGGRRPGDGTRDRG